MPAWFIGFISHWATKTGVIILLIVILCLGAFTIYKGIVNKAYQRGYNQALIDHPQNNYYGPTTVVQGKKMTCFPLHIGNFGFGFCHE